MSSLTITHAQIMDPSQELNKLADVSLVDGKIVQITEPGQAKTQGQTLNANNALLLPGLIDLSAHINNVQSETLAAAKGGISKLCIQPNSKPIVDTPADVSLIQQAADKANLTQLLPLGALTQGLEGEQLANMFSLRQAGCIALSNARAPIKNSLVLRRIMEYAATHDILIMLSAEDFALSANGKMHEGPTSNRLGLAGIAEVAETASLAQQLLLIELTGCRAHFSHISCARSVEMIRDAQDKGMQVSADVAIANLMFTDLDVNGFDSTFNVQPPLRSENDRQALLAGVNDGTLAICSNHKAQDIAAKKAPFAAAEPGMSLLDSWLAMMLKLVEQNELSLEAMVNASAILPAKILDLPSGLKSAELANLVVVDNKKQQELGTNDVLSSGKNNPMIGETLPGIVLLTLSEGREIYRGHASHE